MTILVAGGDRVDAGKTTFAVGLVSHLDAIGFKPRAGNDYWFDHDDVRRAVRDGRLYGTDAHRLAAASTGAVTPEEINPVHRLWRPAPAGDGFIGSAHRTFVLDRVGDTYVVNDRADIPGMVQESLPLDDAPRVRDVDDLNTEMRTRHLPQLDALARRIATTDRAVVESYSDVARPLRSLDVDRVAVVEAGRARVYRGDRYSKACEVLSGGPREGVLEEHVGDVVDHIDPLAEVRLPPLAGDDRSDPDTVAAAYADAYDALV